MKLSKEQIKEILPHRTPMLLVDSVEELTPLQSARSRLYIDGTWEIFRGHFPGDPVMPGLLMVESLAQTVDLIIMTDERYKGLVPLLAGVDKARFRRKIVPGDTVTGLIQVLELDEKRAMITCEAQAILRGETAVEAVITVAMR